MENIEDHPIFKWNQIDDQIFIGTNQCCQTHFDKKLLLKGVTSDISLEEGKVDSPFGVESYLWLPTVDHTPPSQEQLKIGAYHIMHLIDTNRKVYVHCKNGHGRAPTLVAAYYISKGMSVDEAIKKIKDKRQESHINEAQRDGLELFEDFTKL